MSKFLHDVGIRAQHAHEKVVGDPALKGFSAISLASSILHLRLPIAFDRLVPDESDVVFRC